MAEAQYSPHHTTDPETGFMESKSYVYAFDAQKKTQFIRCLVDNGLGIYEACEAMGISHHTLNKHYHNDPVFKEALDEAKLEYGSRLDALSKKNAMNPRSVIERIFQLKSIFPERYADKRDSGAVTVNIAIDEKVLESIKLRQQSIDVVPIPDTQIESASYPDNPVKTGEKP